MLGWGGRGSKTDEELKDMDNSVVIGGGVWVEVEKQIRGIIGNGKNTVKYYLKYYRWASKIIKAAIRKMELSWF